MRSANLSISANISSSFDLGRPFLCRVDGFATVTQLVQKAILM